MVICNCSIVFRFLYVESLKGRRRVLSSFKEKLKRLNVSVLDLSGSYAREGEISVVFVSPNEREALRYLSRIESIVEGYRSETEAMIEYEII